MEMTTTEKGEGIRSCWCTIRTPHTCRDYIGFTLFLLPKVVRGFPLTSLATRGVLDFSAFEAALEALSNYHQFKSLVTHFLSSFPSMVLEGYP